MGERLRLKASFVMPTNWPIPDQAVARALKKYGAIVADNGNFFSISVVPDSRWTNNVFQSLQSLNGGHFEVIQTTTENQGQRTAGVPLVNAGADQTVNVGESATLAGTYTLMLSASNASTPPPKTPSSSTWRKASA